MELSLNHKKNIFGLVAKLDHGQITGVKKLDDGAIKTLSELMQEAINYGMEWRKENESKEPNELPFGDDDED